MKKLTQEELDNMRLKPPGRVSYLRSVFVNMKVGDILLIEPKDWKWKYKSPDSLCRRIEEKDKNIKFSVSRALDAGGWTVKRVK